MASKRGAKKIIDFITDEVIDECFVYIIFNQERDNNDVMDIIIKMNELNIASRYSVNHIDKEISAKKHFSNIYDTLIDTADRSLIELYAITK